MPAVRAPRGRFGLDSKLWNAANLLTLLRLVLAPFAVRAIVTHRPGLALLLIFAAGWTDLFDGIVARKTHSNSEFGQLLDPIADKFLLSGVSLALAWIGSIPVWFVAIVFGRDLLLLLASAFVMAFTSYRDLKPSLFGKASTLFQIFAVGILVLANAFTSPAALTLGMWLLWPTALFTVISGVRYGWRGLSHFTRR